MLRFWPSGYYIQYSSVFYPVLYYTLASAYTHEFTIRPQ